MRSSFTKSWILFGVKFWHFLPCVAWWIHPFPYATNCYTGFSYNFDCSLFSLCFHLGGDMGDWYIIFQYFYSWSLQKFQFQALLFFRLTIITITWMLLIPTLCYLWPGIHWPCSFFLNDNKSPTILLKCRHHLNT